MGVYRLRFILPQYVQDPRLRGTEFGVLGFGIVAIKCTCASSSLKCSTFQVYYTKKMYLCGYMFISVYVYVYTYVYMCIYIYIMQRKEHLEL